jgi:hypothetical protein
MSICLCFKCFGRNGGSCEKKTIVGRVAELIEIMPLLNRFD